MIPRRNAYILFEIQFLIFSLLFIQFLLRIHCFRTTIFLNNLQINSRASSKSTLSYKFVISHFFGLRKTNFTMKFNVPGVRSIRIRLI